MCTSVKLLKFLQTKKSEQEGPAGLNGVMVAAPWGGLSSSGGRRPIVHLPPSGEIDLVMRHNSAIVLGFFHKGSSLFSLLFCSMMLEA